MPRSWHAVPREAAARRERSRLGMQPYPNIAIDGPAGSGKTTVAHALSRHLGVVFLDTGAMYRAVALMALRATVDPHDEPAILALARRRPVRVVVDPEAPRGSHVFAGDEPLGEALYGNDVSRVVSLVAAYPGVRTLMVERQRAIAREGPVIMAGRDIGTVVLPEAGVKIFLTASVDERVERRLAELAARGSAPSRLELRAEIEERDRLDASRAVAPLRPASDAIEVDSSGSSIDAVVERIASIVREAIR